ncbi:MAG: DUF998 domain-containing protein [Actinobacteria bacterium]|nr:DUF998 domain-containing protein [Actinomycetota bacterium]
MRSTPRLVWGPARATALPWWGVASSLLAPVVLIGGWTVAADLQPQPFDAVRRSISALGAEGMPYRWVIAVALIGVGVCHATTGFALRSAAEPGRVMLIIGGVSSILIAVNPQGQHGGSLPHEAFSLIGVVVMTIWPIAGMRREAGAPLGLRPAAVYAATCVTLVIVAWFVVELFNGPQLGLAERAVTADQSIWPLLVVVSVLVAAQRERVPTEQESVSSR